MRKIEKPWGSELIWAHTDKYVAKILTISPGQKLSRQYHEKKAETIYVSSGTLILEIGARLSDDSDYEQDIRPRLLELMDYLEDTVDE